MSSSSEDDLDAAHVVIEQALHLPLVKTHQNIRCACDNLKYLSNRLSLKFVIPIKLGDWGEEDTQN